MPKQTKNIFTIGHSSRPLDVFLALLNEFDIECVVDVRHLPGSRTFPQYNADALGESLSAHNIEYWPLKSLCGFRTHRDLDGAEPETFWTNASFARYAAYARSEAFSQGLRQLIEHAEVKHCVLMCSEAVWWRCHRRIIADHLLAKGQRVSHIMGPKQLSPATVTRGAHLEEDRVIYPRPDAE